MKSKKINLLLTLMLLGSISIANEPMLISETGSDNIVQNEITQINQQENSIKANKETLEKAQSAMSKKDFQSAIVYLSIYIQAKPKKYEAYQMRGECFYQLRQYNLAQKDFEKAIELKTADDKFITGTKVLGAAVLGADKQSQYQNPELGNMYAQLMYAQKAQNISTYELALQKAFEYNSHIYLPQPSKKEINKINCPQKYGKKVNVTGIDKDINDSIELIEKGEFHEALYKTQHITTNYPEYFLGYYLTGVAYIGMDQEQDAITAFQKAIELNPNDFESMASLGQIYYLDAEKTFNPESSKKSIEYFEKAIKYNPNCSTYYYYIGLNHLQNLENEKAITNFDLAIKKNKSDYNSIYYKLIAQQILGDYESVIEGTTNLLYRHVSNYNSVLYLRALAQYKKGNPEAALADIEKIHNNINDIYNQDIKSTSAKEKTLVNYLHYLNAKIIQDKGFGAKADLEKAYKNPIIAKLAKLENATESYATLLDNNEITLDEYNKIKTHYEQNLPKLIGTDLTLSHDDVETQYDYIRSTFDELGITFKYEEPNYSLTTISDYTYKKYAQKLSKTDFQNLNTETMQEPIQNNNIIQEQTESIELKASTDPLDTLLKEEQTSVAKMLATNSLPTITDDNNTPQVMQDEQVAQITEALPNTKSDIEEITEKISEKITETSENITTEASETTESIKKGFLFEAPEQKDSMDTQISYPEKKQAIVEKHANVDLKEFDIQKTTPQINEGDEIVYFDPTNYIKEAGKQFEQDVKTAEANSALKSNIGKIETKTEEITESAQEIIEQAQSTPTIISDKVKSIVTSGSAELPSEVKAPIESTNIIANNTEVQQEAIETPAVIVPALNMPVKAIDEQKDVTISTKKNIPTEEISEQEQKQEQEQEHEQTQELAEEEIAEITETSTEATAKDETLEIPTEEANADTPTNTEETISSIVQSVFIGKDENSNENNAEYIESSEESSVENTQTDTTVEDTSTQKIKKDKKSWFSFFKRKKNKPEITETSIEQTSQLEENIEPIETETNKEYTETEDAITDTLTTNDEIQPAIDTEIIEDKVISAEERLQEKMEEIVGHPTKDIEKKINASTSNNPEETTDSKKFFGRWRDKKDDDRIDADSEIYGLMKDVYGEEISKTLGIENEQPTQIKTNGQKTILKEMKK